MKNSLKMIGQYAASALANLMYIHGNKKFRYP